MFSYLEYEASPMACGFGPAYGAQLMKSSALADIKSLRGKESFVRLTNKEMHALRKQLHGWRVVAPHHLTKTYSFPDFKKALAFVNRIGKTAEHLQHHPDIYLSYGKVEIKTFDHKSKGLVHADFVLAKRIDKLFPGRR